jgi:hypothetical protein
MMLPVVYYLTLKRAAVAYIWLLARIYYSYAFNMQKLFDCFLPLKLSRFFNPLPKICFNQVL